MIGAPQFLSHMAYIASPDRFRDADPPPVDDGQGAPIEVADAPQSSQGRTP